MSSYQSQLVGNLVMTQIENSASCVSHSTLFKVCHDENFPIHHICDFYDFMKKTWRLLSLQIASKNYKGLYGCLVSW